MSGSEKFLSKIALFVMVFILPIDAIFAKESLLPIKLPKEISNPTQLAALEKWAGIDPKRSDSKWEYPKNTQITSVQINDEKWLEVYFELQFVIHPDVTFNQTLVTNLKNNIDIAMRAYNAAGEKINVSFKPYIEIVRSIDWERSYQDELIETIGSKKSVTKEFKVIHFFIYDKHNPFWEDNAADKSKKGSAFSYISSSEGYLVAHDLTSITHELTHLLLHNEDAYFKEGWEDISEENAAILKRIINAANCNSNFVNPIEIYISLKRKGFIPPKWNEYVDNFDRVIVATGLKNQFQIYRSIPTDVIEASNLHITVYNLEGKKVFDKNYMYMTRQRYKSNLEFYKEVMSIKNYSEVSNFLYKVDLNFLPLGTYLIQASIAEISNEEFIITSRTSSAIKTVVIHNSL